MIERKLFEILREARDNGSLMWLIAAGVVPPAYEEWLKWYEYKQQTTLEFGLRGSRDRTISYFDNYYATHRSGGIRSIDYPIFDYAMKRMKTSVFM